MKRRESSAVATEQSAADFLPPELTLESMREAAQGCRGCALYKRATQAVFGAGAVGARMMFVGEQPGDQEDQSGAPFVGPAGRLLDSALKEAGIGRQTVYVTNAVKHFKWTQQGKRRLHSKPSAREVAACRPWLEAELSVVQPRIVIALGATAAQSMLGPAFRVTQQRGKVLQTDWGVPLLATVHPSSILRAPDDAARHEAYALFVRDLRVAAKATV